MSIATQTCSKCNGKGFVGRLKPDGNVEAVPCECALRSQRLTGNGLPEHMLRWRFDTSNAYPQVNAALSGIYGTLTTKPFGATFVVLNGNNGSGKTNALACACNHAVDMGIQSYYTTVHAMLSGIKQRFGDRRAYDDYMDRLARVPVLALDELTRYQETEWSRPVIENLIEARYRPGIRYTLVAFNGLLNEQTVGPYLLSRFTDAVNSLHYLVQGVDLRQVSGPR